MIGSVHEMIEQFKNGKHDFTVNGKCSGCGECCSRILPLSGREIDRIRLYVKANNLKPHRPTPPLAKPTITMICPFMDGRKEENKCDIYDIRPDVCRDFLCTFESQDKKAHSRMLSEQKQIVDMWDTFFHGAEEPVFKTMKELIHGE